MSTRIPAAKILLVDDNPVILSTVTKLLHATISSRVQVSTARDGKEALGAARKSKPNLVLLDWMMPKFGGGFFLDEQAKDSELMDIPVIIFTASDDPAIDRQAKNYSAVKQVLRKPTPPSQLCDSIRPYLGLKGESKT